MKENENRIINPAAYTTPASVFNTLAVEVDPTKTINNDLALKTTKLPVSEFLKLDNTITRDEKAMVLNRLQQDKITMNSNDPKQNQIKTQNPSSMPPATHKFSNVCPLVQHNTPLGSIDPRFTAHQFSYNDSSEGSLQSLPLAQNSRTCGLTTDDRTQVIYDFGRNVPVTRQMSGVCGSLERNVLMPHFNKTGASRSIGGSLERNKSFINPVNPPRKCVPRSASLERSVYNRDFPKSYSRSGSLEAYSSFLAFKNHMKNSPEYKAFEEEIYDVCPAANRCNVAMGQTYMPMTPGNGFGYPNTGPNDQRVMIQSMNANCNVNDQLTMQTQLPLQTQQQPPPPATVNDSDRARDLSGNNSKVMTQMMAEVWIFL